MDGSDRQREEGAIFRVQAGIEQWLMTRKKKSFYNFCNDGTCILFDQCQHKTRYDEESFFFQGNENEFDRERKSQKNI